MDSLNESLMDAAMNGDESELESLLRRPGCDARRKNDEGMSALMFAAKYGNVACVRLLLKASDALDKDRHGMTALMWGARNGDAACVQLLIQVSDVVAQDKLGDSALMHAGAEGWAPCVKLLIPLSDVGVLNSRGLTAADEARDRGYPRVAALIDDYAHVLSKSETAALNASTPSGVARKAATRRV